MSTPEGLVPKHLRSVFSWMILTTVALAKLQKENTLDVNFIMNSTEKNIVGNPIDAKEWQLMIPLVLHVIQRVCQKC